MAGTQPAPKSATPSGHTSAVGVAAAQVVLLPNFASSLEHTAEVAVAASQPEPKLAWPSGHVSAVAVALTHPAPKSDRPGGHAASQPAPKSASPTGQPAAQGAAMYALHFPADSAAKSSLPGPRCTCSVYCCWGFLEARTEFSRLGTRRASAETARRPDPTITDTTGGLA